MKIINSLTSLFFVITAVSYILSGKIEISSILLGISAICYKLDQLINK